MKKALMLTIEAEMTFVRHWLFLSVRLRVCRRAYQPELEK
jgi:hypothetical protein